MPRKGWTQKDKNPISLYRSSTNMRRSLIVVTTNLLWSPSFVHTCHESASRYEPNAKYGRPCRTNEFRSAEYFFGGLLPLPCRSSGPPHERARPTTTQPRARTPLVWPFPRRAGPHRPTAYHSSRVSPRAEGGLSVPAVTAAEGGEQDARGLRDRRLARPLRLVAPAPLARGPAAGPDRPQPGRRFRLASFLLYSR